MKTCESLAEQVPFAQFFKDFLKIPFPDVPTMVVDTDVKDFTICKDDSLKLTLAVGTLTKYSCTFVCVIQEVEDNGAFKQMYAFSVKYLKVFDLSQVEILGRRIEELKVVSLTVQELVFGSNVIPENVLDLWNEKLEAQFPKAGLQFQGPVVETGLRLLGVLQVINRRESVVLFMGFGESDNLALPLRTVDTVDTVGLETRDLVWRRAQLWTVFHPPRGVAV